MPVGHHLNSRVEALRHNVEAIMWLVSAKLNSCAWNGKRKLSTGVLDVICSDVHWAIVLNLTHDGRENLNLCAINFVGHGVDPTDAWIVPSGALIQLCLESTVL